MIKLSLYTLKLFTSLIVISLIFPYKVKSQIGSEWKEITSREEARQKNQLENYKNPSGDNTPFNWPILASFIDKEGNVLSSLSDEATAKYEWDTALNTHTFTLIKFPGNRSEIRIHDNYKTGSRQFEGYLTMNEKLDKQAVFQLFGSSEGATQMQIRGFGHKNGGSLEVNYDTKMPSEGNKTIVTCINNKEIRLNVIHLQEDSGDVVIVYINGEEKFRFKDGETLKNGQEFFNYMKYGIYGREKDGEFDGVENMQTKWRNVRLWEGGTP